MSNPVRKKKEGAKAPSFLSRGELTHKALTPQQIAVNITTKIEHPSRFYGKLTTIQPVQTDHPINDIKANIQLLLQKLKKLQELNQSTRRLFVFRIDDLFPNFTVNSFNWLWLSKDEWLSYLQIFISTVRRAGFIPIVLDFESGVCAPRIYHRLECMFNHPYGSDYKMQPRFLTYADADFLLDYPKWLNPLVSDKVVFKFWEKEGRKPVSVLEHLKDGWKKSFQSENLSIEHGKPRIQTVVCSLDHLKILANGEKLQIVIKKITKNVDLAII